MRGYKLHKTPIKNMTPEVWESYHGEKYQTQVVKGRFYYRISPAWSRKQNKLGMKPVVGMAKQRLPVMSKKSQRQLAVSKLSRHIKRYFGMLSVIALFLGLANVTVVYAESGVVAPTWSKNVNVSPIRFTEPELEAFKVSKGSPASIYDIIHEVFGKDAQWAIRCFKTESGLNQYATGYNRNGTRDYGLAQVNSVHCGKVSGDCASALYDIRTNLEVAKIILDTQGRSAWYGRGC